MREVVVKSVSVAEGGVLLVAPTVYEGHPYEFVYRAANCVRWDSKLEAFFVPPVHGLKQGEQFLQITNALESEFGEVLVTDEKSDLSAAPSFVRDMIRNTAV